MDPERWRRIEEVFDAALDLPSEDRAAFLDRYADDPDLRARVERLLANSDLPTPLPAASADVADLAGRLIERDGPPSRAEAAAPTTVGPYRIERELGQGGMGTVFLGERDDGEFRQSVAIKLLRRGLATDELMRRFRHERQILATLDHPHIARLFDGGVLDGTPYIVMEYVEGTPITAHCAAVAAPTSERLRLFENVCEAVQFAHQNLVVHRDLKPSNILVTTDGRAKLLDFGIAKLLDDGADTDPLTRTGMHVMTPEYAAPEQVRGGPVTTATDVYALGVLLYELLVGTRPYTFAGRSLSEVERVVCEVDPPRPSTAIGRVARESAAGRPPRRRLDADLDVIVMKALHKDPARRYPSAAALLEDLRRHRSGHPVLARPDSAAYRARKFVGRNRIAVTAALFLVVASVTFTVHEGQLRRRAETAAERAAAVSGYLASVFEVSDPYAAGVERAEDITARQLLDQGLERVDELIDQPEAQAEMLGILGSVYTNLGLLDRAEPLLDRSLARRLDLYGDGGPEIADAMESLGSLYLEQGRLDDAERAFRKALAIRRRTVGDRDVLTARVLDRLATVLQERSAYADAEPLFREALAIRERALGPEHAQVAESVNNLALLFYWMGDYDQAETLYRRSVEINRRVLGPDHGTTGTTEHNLAQVLHLKGAWDAAEALFRSSLVTRRKAFGDAHPRTTVHLNNLGALLRDMGKLGEAEAHIREALMLDRQIFGPEHSYVAAGLAQLAGVLRDLGRFDEAEAAYDEALGISRRVLGENHVRVVQSLEGIGTVRMRRGDPVGAEEPYRAALEIANEIFPDDNPWPVAVGIALARSLVAQGRADEAEPMLRAMVDRFPPDHVSLRNSIISAHVGLGQALVGMDRFEEAEPLLRNALDLTIAAFGETNFRVPDTRVALGQALAGLGRASEAREQFDRARAGLDATPVQLPAVRALIENR